MLRSRSCLAYSRQRLASSARSVAGDSGRVQDATPKGYSVVPKDPDEHCQSVKWLAIEFIALSPK